MLEYMFDFTPRVGYAFVPPQRLGEIYSLCEALEAGTLFPELNISMEEYVPKQCGGCKK
ncbi:MAG: spore coat associated protein CotJA [Clostridia bacterium]|nr:spore coat associated protein CotJA [Clostridia bacterium]